MKLILIFSTFLLLSACYKRGADSKKVRLWSFDVVSDGNNGDSTFFYVEIRNENDVPLIDPKLDFVIKDTTSKWLFGRLFSDYQNLPEIAPQSTYQHYIYAGDFQITDEVGKVKIRLDWTNSKGKNSVIRYVEHQ
jgi:hypothetical protein